MRRKYKGGEGSVFVSVRPTGEEQYPIGYYVAPKLHARFHPDVEAALRNIGVSKTEAWSCFFVFMRWATATYPDKDWLFNEDDPRFPEFVRYVKLLFIEGLHQDAENTIRHLRTMITKVRNQPESIQEETTFH